MTTTQRAVSTALALGALLGMHGSASATATTVHASICVGPYHMPAADMTRGVGGVINVSSHKEFFTCPLVRSKDVSVAGMHAFVSGFVPDDSTIECTVWSLGRSGAEIGRSFHFTGPGNFHLGKFLSQAEVPLSSSQSVVCFMPPKSKLFNITMIL